MSIPLRGLELSVRAGIDESAYTLCLQRVSQGRVQAGSQVEIGIFIQYTLPALAYLLCTASGQISKAL